MAGARCRATLAEDRADRPLDPGDRGSDRRGLSAVRHGAGDRLARSRPDQFFLGRGGRRIRVGVDDDDRRRHRDWRTRPFHLAGADASLADAGAARDPCRDASLDRRVWRARRLVWGEAGDRQQPADLAGLGAQSRLALCGASGRRRAHRALWSRSRVRAAAATGCLSRLGRSGCGERLIMLLASTGLLFAFLVAFSMPIVFALGAAAILGLVLGGYSLEMLASSLIGASQNWILLAIPSFIFAGTVMERCGMSNALVDLARALVGWLRGGLGMSVIVVSYFFSDICGSKMAEVSALGSTLMPPLRRAGYRSADGASLIASGTAMGMLVPPAIFMIVIGEVTNVSVAALFLAGFIPAAVIGVCLCALVAIQAHLLGWPKVTRPSLAFLLHSLRQAAVPLVIPLVILGGFYLGAFTATEAGAIVALYSLLAARLYYRNLSWREIVGIGYESAVLTAVVIFLLAVATIFQYLMGVTGVPLLLGELLRPLESAHWLFLVGVALITMVFGMVLEGLPAAVVLIPVVFPIAMRLGINPIHFDIVQTAAVGIGLFLPPMGVGLLMALKFADVSVGQHARGYWPYVLALLIGLMLIICLPELSLAIPRSAGFVR